MVVMTCTLDAATGVFVGAATTLAGATAAAAGCAGDGAGVGAAGALKVLAYWLIVLGQANIRLNTKDTVPIDARKVVFDCRPVYLHWISYCISQILLISSRES